MKTTFKTPKVHSLSLAVALGLSTIVCQTAYANDKDKYAKIGDLEIYQAPEQGVATLAMMVDVSRSMYAVDLDTPRNIGSMIMFETACLYDTAQTAGDAPPNETIYTVYKRNNTREVADVFTTGLQTHYQVYYDQYGQQRASYLGPNHVFYRLSKNHSGNNVAGQYWRTGAKVAKRPTNLTISVPITDSKGNAVAGNKTANFTIQACAETQTGTVKYENGSIVGGKANRIGALKLGLISFLANGQLAEERNRIAMGHFPSNGTGKSGGSMQVPADKLTVAHREKLINYIASLDPNGGTPVASAYAEAAAYLLGGTTNVAGAGDYSGFAMSNSATKNSTGKYKSPFEGEKVSECAGNGIFFLTDGKPNLSSSYTPELMRQAFGKPVPASSPRMTTVGTAASDNTSGWEYTGDFAKALLATHPYSKTGFRTATIGFGGVFDSLTEEANQRTVTITNGTKSKTETIPDCSKGSDQDVRNLCLLGELGGDYGKGGFTATDKPEGLKDALQKFFQELDNTVAATPSGTISIPKDPLNASTIQPYAYVPMIQPYVGKDNAVWDGNLKKYHTLYGTLYGKNKQRLYVKNPKATTQTKNFPSAINPNAQDVWQTGTAGGSAVAVGGTRDALAKQTTGRVVYIEGRTNDAKKEPKLVKVHTVVTKDNQGKVTAVTLHLDDVPQSNALLTQHGYTAEEMAFVKAYLTGDTTFGGVAHSVPVLAAYKGKFKRTKASAEKTQEQIDLDATEGNIDSVDGREDYLIYGTMEGSLRMANAVNGQEKFAFIPRTILKEQAGALKAGSKSKELGRPYFGVDAPWATFAKYKTTDTGVEAESMYAYGGLRMGGVGFYGLDISKTDEAPKLAFAITNKTTGFERLGQTWAKPTVAKIRTQNLTAEQREQGQLNKDRLKDVLIFGGGYDMCYENPRFVLNDTANTAGHTDAEKANCITQLDKDGKPVPKTQAQGNAIYMVDAKDGTLLASWHPESTDVTGSGAKDMEHMKHSFVSEIVVLDRNNNGIVDSLYASDLGGQLFRIDLKEGVEPESMTRRVVRVFDANHSGALPAGAPPLRFYEKPAVSFYDKEGGGTLAMVNIASGDRSSPLHKHRDTVEKANRIYGIIDRDLTTFRVGQSGVDHLKIRNLTHDNLHSYKHSAPGTNADRVKWIKQLKNADGKHSENTKTIHGWWYPMTNFDRFTNVKHLKAIGSSIVSANVFHTSVYNPEYQYVHQDQCSAQITGATERQKFCLPWGICANEETGELTDGSKNGTLGFVKAGPGIQELAMTTITSAEHQSTNFKTFVGQESISERDNKTTETGANQGDDRTYKGDGTEYGPGHNDKGGDYKIVMDRRLSVERWYDLANAESGQ